MENYIYLSWIHIFAVTFWYNDDIEKPYRFQYILDTLKKVNFIDTETLNILLLSIITYGDESMIIKLYEILIKLGAGISNYTIFSYIMERFISQNEFNRFNIRMSFKEKKFSNTSNRSHMVLIPSLNLNLIDVVENPKFRQRTLKNKDGIVTLKDKPNDEISFIIEDNCMECHGYLNVEILSINYEKMRKNLFWATCHNCKKNILPKIGIKIGESSVNSKDSEDENSAIIEKVVLYSPFYLKYNYNIGLMKEFNLKLDVESFRNRFNVLFWNSIWYFTIVDLPFDFMLPYQEELEPPLKSRSRKTINFIDNSYFEKKMSIEKTKTFIIQDTSFENLEITSPISIFIIPGKEIKNFNKNVIELSDNSPELGYKNFIDVSSLRSSAKNSNQSVEEICNKRPHKHSITDIIKKRRELQKNAQIKSLEITATEKERLNNMLKNDNSQIESEKNKSFI
jgi:hypothetical protein